MHLLWRILLVNKYDDDSDDEAVVNLGVHSSVIIIDHLISAAGTVTK